MYYHPLLEKSLQYKNIEHKVKERYQNYAFLSFVATALLVFPLILLIQNLASSNVIKPLVISPFVILACIFFHQSQKKIKQEKIKILSEIDILLKDTQLKEKLVLTTKFVLIKDEKVSQPIALASSLEVVNHILNYEKDYTQLTLLSHSKEVIEEIQKDLIDEKVKKFNQRI